MKHNIGQKIKITLWVLFAVVIGVSFASAVFSSVFETPQYEKMEQPKENIADIPEPSPKIEEAPKYFYLLKNKNQKPKVSALSFLVGDLDTGEVILSKNKEKQFPIASISKLMTALVARDMAGPLDTTSVSKGARDTYGSNGNLRIGEKIKITDLIYPLLLESSNDAGEAIAEYFDRDVFISKMNQTARKLELYETNFEDPSGLSSLNQSNVEDLFRLAGYIKQKKPELLETTTKRSYSNKKHTWFSNNQFLSEDGYLGGKSGYTDSALQTVISLFEVPLSKTGTRNIAITLLQSKDRFKDVENILRYIKKNVYYGGESDTNTLWVRERTDIPDYEQDFVTLIFGGDIMLDRGVRNSVNKNFNGDYSALFEKLVILKRPDIAFANLEGPTSDVGVDRRNLYSFRMDPSTVPALRGAGLSIVSVANNHVGDWGRDAYSDTLVRLKENEILYTGGGQNETEAEQPTIIEKYGMKIGFLGFSDVGPDSMKAGDDKAGLLLASNPRFDEIVANASKQVDYLVVSFHFGNEYEAKRNQRQEYLAHKAVDAGAKIVIGHHPHVIQDTEVYKDGFIVYSLGNFIFDQGFSEETMQGLLLEMKLWRDGDMSIKKNILKLNKFFQPDKIIAGKEEKIKFKE